MSEEEKQTSEPEKHSCGYVEDSFACKIRHIHMNTGDANMARHYNEMKKKEKQIKDYGV